MFFQKQHNTNLNILSPISIFLMFSEKTAEENRNLVAYFSAVFGKRWNLFCCFFGKTAESFFSAIHTCTIVHKIVAYVGTIISVITEIVLTVGRLVKLCLCIITVQTEMF